MKNILNILAIGCRKADLPTASDIDENNLIMLSFFCEPAILKDYCLPDKSFIKFGCKEVFSLDKEYG